MDVHIEKRAVRQIRLSAADTIEEGDTEALREDILHVFADHQIDEIEQHLGGIELADLLAGVLEEWSGDDVDLGSNNATATNIADPAGATYPTCMDTSMTCSTTRSSTKVAVGLDVIEYDTQLSNLSVEQMFINFFGTSMANYRESRVTLEVAAANVNNLSTADPPGVDLATGEVIWVEGNADIGKVTVGCAVSTTGGNICPAASVDPSITIINGDLTTSGTPQFYGFLYVTGRVFLSSNTTIHGAIVVSGELQSSTSGSLDIWYNSDYLNQTRDNGPLGGAPGSWRDW